MTRIQGVFLAGLLALGACRNSSTPDLASTETAARDSYQNQAQTRLANLEKKIEELQATARTFTGKTSSELYREIALLEEKRTEARIRFDELKSSTGKAWSDIKTGLDAALDDLEKSSRDAAKRYQ